MDKFPNFRFEQVYCDYEDVERDELPPCNMMVDVGLDDVGLIDISTKDLNKLLKRKGVSKERMNEIKQRRRTLKNRGYAANCRVKRDEEEEDIKKSIVELNTKLQRKIRYIESVAEGNEEMADILRRYGYSEEHIRKIRQEGFHYY